MNIWAIIQDNKIVNRIIADSKELAESLTGLEAIPDEPGMGIGQEKTEFGWRYPYPTDGKDYIWNDEFKLWIEIVDEEPEETSIN